MNSLKNLSIILIALILLGYSGYAQLIIKTPKQNDKLRYGRSVLVSWDTNGTYNKNFKFTWSTSPSGTWGPLPLPKGKSTFKDSTKNQAAIGSVSITFPNQQSLWLKIEEVNNPSFNAVVGPLSVVVSNPSPIDEYIQGTITSNKTLTANKIWGLKGVVFVANGATLTIEPGTIVMGSVGETSALCINRGGKIIADGTPTKPIVFTSGVVAGSRDRGDWGGLLIMGKAPTNLVEAPIEGGIADDANTRVNGWFGGNDPNDNSGILRYVRIEFAGIAESPDNELNGLTLGAVGAGTIIDHVQVSYSNDDSYEWFGGTVNCKHLIAYNAIDDDFDTDNGYRGIVQFGLEKRLTDVADQSNSEAFESDNDASASEKQPFTSPLFSNITVIGPVQDTSWTKGTGVSGTNTFHSKFLTAAQIRRNSRMGLANSVIFGWPGGVELTNQNTVRAAENDSILVRYNDFYGIKGNKYFYFGGGTNPTEAVDLNWLSKSEFSNNFTNGSGMVDALAYIENGYNIGSFNPLPTANASYMTSAKFDYGRLTDPFLEKVSYRGAFGSDRWDLGWSEYDPVNKEYKVTGIDDIQSSNDKQIIIYPQPANKILNIKLNSIENQNSILRISDINGKEIKGLNIDFLKFGDMSEYQINTEELTNGIYILELITTNYIAPQLLIINK
ncbi:MAG: T9SS type A sorting domain-containing protein [Ignavibacteriae bacterium]|nr:T9SS type A sorting domain-containing protein [Ignavibacteriota bacterium]